MKNQKFYDVIVEMDEDKMNKLFEKIERLEKKFPGLKITKMEDVIAMEG